MMKTFKYILSTFLVIAVIWSCTEDELNNLDFTNSAVAPTNVSLLLDVTQDNTGLVTMTPNSVGAISYSITFGDDTTEAVDVKQGETIEHIYAEGSYDISVVAVGVTGLKTEFQQPILVSFQAPIFGTEPIIENDAAVSKKVNVTVPNDAQFAMVFDVYFVEDSIETIITGNVGETVSFTYANAGLVDIKVVLKGGAIETVEFIKTDFEVTAILAPLNSAPTPPARGAADVISIYGDAYTNVAGTNYNPDWGQSGQGSGFAEFDLNGDKMLQYINLSYQGIGIGETIDVSGMEYLHMDVWTAAVTVLETSLINGVDGNSTEAPVLRDLTADSWTSIDIPISEYTDQGLTVDQIFQLKLVGTPWAGGTVFVDNIYFHKAPSAPSVLAGTWKLAPEAGALKVGPSPDNGDWWTSDAQAVIDRACLFDDTYVFGSDGSFSNVLGADTWLEAWQGVAADACGTPVAPHNGVAGTFTHVGNTVTINGAGSYLGIPKANNAGELPNVAVPTSITYDIILSDNDNAMTVIIEAGGGVFWTFRLVRDGGVPSPIEGTWKLANEAGSLAVGPAPDNLTWWSISADDVANRACFYDDTYVFNADGSFQNILGSDTWLEPWQGMDPEACGAPVAPHNGSNPATWSSSDTSVTISGLGAYLGLPKVHNAGEDGLPVNNTITYDYVLSDDNNVMELQIVGYNGTGGTETWYFKFVKEGSSTGGGGSTTGTQIDFPVDFESATVDYTLTDFGENSSSIVEDPTNASNTVAKVIKTATAATWAGTTIGTDLGFATNIPVTLTNSKMSVRVWSPTAGTPILLKIEDANDNTHTCETLTNTTVAGGWETLEFDFVNEATGTALLSVGLDNGWVYNKASIFFNFGTDGATAGEQTYYFDDVLFVQ